MVRWGSTPKCISIHALREESDVLDIEMLEKDTNFNPRSP